jgi:hypothetical protein
MASAAKTTAYQPSPKTNHFTVGDATGP